MERGQEPRHRHALVTLNIPEPARFVPNLAGGSVTGAHLDTSRLPVDGPLVGQHTGHFDTAQNVQHPVARHCQRRPGAKVKAARGSWCCQSRR